MPFEVLSRRDQLGLAADIKAERDAKKGKGKGKKGDQGEEKAKGRGSGRGGGRGRGRGRGRSAASASDPPEIPEVTENTTPERPRRTSKRHPPAGKNTPERKVLFPDEPENPSKVSPAKPPKKRVRGKRQVAAETPEVEVPQEGEAMTEAPKAKAKAKQRCKPKQTKAEAEIEGKGEDNEKNNDNDNDKVEGPPQGKERKVSKAAREAALKCLKDAKTDQASWFHVEKLFTALKAKKPKTKHDVPKFDHWGLSMYWSSSRVGLLQKQQTRFQHILSFGGVYCKNIAMPVLAATMYVTWSHKVHMP